jgi:hypothetical protein
MIWQKSIRTAIECLDVWGSRGRERNSQAHSVHLQTSLTPTISVGQDTTITADLPSAPNQSAGQRASCEVISYIIGGAAKHTKLGNLTIPVSTTVNWKKSCTAIR